jgi:hypothetical protein
MRAPVLLPRVVFRKAVVVMAWAALAKSHHFLIEDLLLGLMLLVQLDEPFLEFQFILKPFTHPASIPPVQGRV